MTDKGNEMDLDENGMHPWVLSLQTCSSASRIKPTPFPVAPQPMSSSFVLVSCFHLFVCPSLKSSIEVQILIQTGVFFHLGSNVKLTL